MANTKVYQSGCEGFPPVTASMMFGHRAKFTQRRQEDFLLLWEGEEVGFHLPLRREKWEEIGSNSMWVSTFHSAGWPRTHAPHAGECVLVFHVLLTTGWGTSSTHCKWEGSQTWNQWITMGWSWALNSYLQEARSFADIYQRIVSEIKESHLPCLHLSDEKPRLTGLRILQWTQHTKGQHSRINIF